jgi:hypothetical protein
MEFDERIVLYVEKEKVKMFLAYFCEILSNSP